jgi:hypothetical protein
MTEVQHLLLDGVDLTRRKPFRRQDRPTVPLSDADYDLAASPVVEIVGERAQGPDHVLRVPPFLELQALPLDHLAGEEILDV